MKSLIFGTMTPKALVLGLSVTLLSCAPSVPGAELCVDPDACETECLNRVESMRLPTSAPAPYATAACEFTRFSGGASDWEGVGCWCNVTAESSGDFVHEGEGECSNYGRGGECLYRSDEFPGCDVQDARSCDAICEDLHQRKTAHAAATLELVHRDSLCSSSGCHCAYKNGESCFLNSEFVPFSCDASIPEMQQATRVAY